MYSKVFLHYNICLYHRLDPRFPMSGPSPGVILSQPAMMGGGGRGMFGGGDSLERRGRRRGYSIEDDLDHIDEMDVGEGPSGKVSKFS